MYVDLRDEGICRDLFLCGKREPVSTEYLMNSGVLKEKDIVLDIGANIGYYAIMEAKLVGDSGRVYAIEPVSSNIKTLKRNVYLNNCKNTKIFHLAMGDENKKRKIYVSEKCNISSFERNAATGGAEQYRIIDEEKVNLVTVDSFLKDKETPNLIRMDVEGYEYYIIKGAPETLEKNVKILMEMHSHLMTKEQIKEMLKILTEHGFKVQCVIFDGKISVNQIARRFLEKLNRKKGYFLSLDISIKGLQHLLIEGGRVSPHVLFSKTAET